MSKLLIIDDEALEKAVIRKMILRIYGDTMDVLESSFTPSLQHVLEDNQVDIILVNCFKKMHSLIQLITFIRKVQNHTHIILTSSDTEKEVLIACNQLEADGYLLKPFTQESLGETIDSCLQEEDLEVLTEWEVKKQDYLQQLEEACQQGTYKKSIKVTKEYIDFIYQNCDTNGMVCARILDFSNDILTLAQEYHCDLYADDTFDTAQIKFLFSKDYSQYRVYCVFTRMIDKIFDTIYAHIEDKDEVNVMLNYIDRNIRKDISLDFVAGLINMSPSYFSKFFKKATGINFIKYVTDTRIEIAKEMLTLTDIPVINIAYEVSYNETGYFSKSFKKKVGLTPSEYRDKYGKLGVVLREEL